MRGVDNIIKMRLRGFKPHMVTIETMGVQKWADQLTIEPSKFVDIHMSEADAAKANTLDLRCLHGIDNVLVNGKDRELVYRLAKACERAGAVTVYANTFSIGRRVELVHSLKIKNGQEIES